ncbi:MAG: SDR family oxidoreductase [Clostridiales bacterium]|nr:SDR family oxidoreductase [Candidatus Crickella merdequi]
MTNNKSKRVLITDGSSPVGSEAVRHFVARGATVVFLYNSEQNQAFELSRETGALAVRCNAGSMESVRNAMGVIREYLEGEVDVLINNADIEETRINSMYYCTKPVLHLMIKQGSGSIINVCSCSGNGGLAEKIRHSSARAGAEELTISLAREMAAKGIRINCIVSNDKYCSPDSVVNLIEFLASSKARYISGQSIDINGGFEL